MKIKNLLCSAAIASMFFVIGNPTEAGTHKYNVEQGEYTSYINETVTGQTINNYIYNYGTISDATLNLDNNDIVLGRLNDTDYSGGLFIDNHGNIYTLTLNMKNNEVISNSGIINKQYFLNNYGSIGTLNLTMDGNTIANKSAFVQNIANGSINTLNINFTNNTLNEDITLIQTTAENNNYSKLYNIKGNISNNTINGNMFTFGMGTRSNNIDLIVDNNKINNSLITSGLATVKNVYGTYTNNYGGGALTAAALGGFESIDITYKNNDLALFLGAIGVAQKINAVATNNNLTKNLGLITLVTGFAGKVSGTYENNSNKMNEGSVISNIGGIIGITTKNGKNTIFNNNGGENGEGSGINNAGGRIAFNTDKNGKIIINDKITGNLDNVKKTNEDAASEFISLDEDAIKQLEENGNVILINPSKAEHMIAGAKDGINFEEAIAYLDTNKTTGTIEFNNLISDNDIYIYDGTLKLGSWIDDNGTKHYGDFDNVNLNLVGGTLNTIDKEIRNINVVNLTSTNGKLSVDLDLSNNTADTLTAELVNGTFDFNNINFIGTPVNTNGTVQIIAGNIGEDGLSFKDFTTFDSDFNTYTFTDAGNGYVKYQYSKGDGNVTLKMAVDYANGDRSFNMTKNEVVQEDLGFMAGDESTLTVNGNGLNIDGNGYMGVFVNAGQTFNINDAIVENFNTETKSEYAGVVTSMGNIENLSGEFNNNYSSYTAGVLYNVGTVNNIEGSFTNNSSDGDEIASGVILNVSENATIDKINGTFTGNTATNGIAGVISNFAGSTINSINGTYANNSSMGSGVITNYAANIGSIDGTFTGNNAAVSGAIINITGDDDLSVIDKITGTFENNYADCEEYGAGAILNMGAIINEVSGTFKNNSSKMFGGAISNFGDDDFSAIYGIEGTFENNSALAGGAIVNVEGIINIVADTMDTSFTGNKDITGSNALISMQGMINLNADTDKSIIFNDTVGFDVDDYLAVMEAMGEDVSNVTAEDKKDFYNEFSAQDNMININAMKGDYNTYKAIAIMQGATEEEINSAKEEEMAEFIKMADEEMLNMMNLPNYNQGTIQFNNTVKNSMVSLMNGTLKFGTNTQDGVEYVGGLDENSILNVFGGTVSLQNAGINNANLGNVQLFNDMNLQLDADLANETIDTISANSFNVNNKQINITNINLLSPTTKETLSLSPLSNDMDATTRQNIANAIQYTGGEAVYSPIYKYTVEYDPTTANLNFGLKPYSAPIENFNPAVITKPVAQNGAQNVQLDSYTEAFRNMDMFMLMPENERLAYKYRNKYAALTDDLVYDPTMSTYQNNTAWFRPYTTFENVPLKNGPKVSNVSYGSYFGYDSSLTELGKGWDGTLGVYAGYNGSHQTFQGNSIYQNGGTLGVIGVAYKGNFFSGWTLNIGASAGSTNNMYGTDNFTSIMGGLSTKNGYNFEFADGKVIVQPSLLMSYALVNTFDYTSASGVRMKSDPLHTLQLEPSIKVIGNLGSWQPYANVAMVWNILNETKVTANDVRLPDVSVKPYVKYGVGLQKKWADKFTAFGQAYVTNGGRNGVGLQAGLRIALGDETKKPKAAWLNPKKKDTVIVLDGKVK